MTEFKGDKRTKAYREWKAKYEKESSGVGDTVERFTKATGIKKAVEFIAGEDCGCNERKNVLNRMFPYQKPNCLTEDEFNYLSEWFSQTRNKITSEQQNRLVEIYNRVFNDKFAGTSCGSCLLNSVIKKLEKVFQKYR